MTNFELILNPYKRIKLKLELVSANSDNDFLSLKRNILWEEYSNTTWGSLADQTWEQISYRVKNDSDAVLMEMSADVLSAQLSISSASDVRRTISLSAHMDDPRYFTESFNSAWLNRLLRINFGLYDFAAHEYVWFPIGSFLLTQSDYSFNAQTQQLDMALGDLMVALTQERGNQIGTKVVLPEGQDIEETLAEVVEQFFPFNYIDICNFGGEKVPYELEFSRGIYPYEIAKKLVELYPGYEHFFSTDGVYTVKEVPIGLDEPVILTADQIDQLIISDQGTLMPQTIKNVTEVWGQEIDAERTAETCDGTSAVGQYKLFIDEELETLENNMTISFTPDRNCENGQAIKVQDCLPYPIVNESGEGEIISVGAGELQAGRHYVVRYSGEKFILLGESEVHAMCFLYNKKPSDAEMAILESKYNCNNIRVIVDDSSQYAVEWIGERIQVFTDGDFENIHTSTLAEERAYYENWQTARMQDVLRLEMLYVPWLDVNQKVEYRSIVDGKVRTYLVNAIEINFENCTMAVELHRYYPMYPWLRVVKTWSDYANNTWGDLESMYWDDMAYEEYAQQ